MTPTRSSLIPGKTPDPHDAQVARALEAIPRAAAATAWSAEMVGILNAAGEVYRQVRVANAMELLQVTAALNSLGYAVDKGRSAAYARQYARTFSRVAGATARPPT